MTTLFLALFACSTPDTPAPTTPADAHAEKKAEKPSKAKYTGRFASDPKLTPEDVAKIPQDQLRIVRNEVFARHGRKFKSDDLQEHFGAQAWYTPSDDFKDSMLTANDRHNVALIQSFEGDMSKKALAKGEFNGSNRTLALVDPKTAEILDDQEDMYNWERASRSWTSRGNWVLTWEGGSDPAKGADAQLWELDLANGTILSVRDLKTQG